MSGFQNNNNLKILNQWYQFFVRNGELCIPKIYLYWLNVEYLGLPNIKDKFLKYSPIEWLLNYNYVNNLKKKITIYDLNNLSLNINAYRLVFIDGFFSKYLSDVDIGLWCFDIKFNYNYLFEFIKVDFFLYLMESLCRQITYIYLPENCKVIKPLYILHISTGLKKKKLLNMIQYRHHIDLKFKSKGKIIEHFVSFSKKYCFCISRTSISVSNIAFLNYTKLISENNLNYFFDYNDINVYYSSTIIYKIFIFSGILNYYNFNIKFNSKRSNFFIYTLCIPFKYSIININTYIEHKKNFCFSYQLYKIILFYCCKLIFYGLIKIFKNIIKTESLMINHNLLLNNLSEINTKPYLEIYTDDVKCNHGVTVLQIDKNQLFYLQSRGISYFNSYKIIIYGFASEIIKIINCNKLIIFLFLFITRNFFGVRYNNELSN